MADVPRTFDRVGMQRVIRATKYVESLPRRRETQNYGDPPYIFQGKIVRVKITGAASGGGKYTGRVMTAVGADVSASGDLSAAEIGTTPGANDALVLNLNEVGQSTHILTDASNTYEIYFIGFWTQTNSDGTKVVEINGFFGGSC